ncbi:hypothetical protein [Streptomyces geranii]|uniref:hypothetical protein n=1 Tax=Streptomyces geranii TaxID=2058923 RepID=UPI0018E524CE|nr:hypothetical protein [Streptomyces geranii]
MLDQLRDDLDQAGDWVEYRGRLKAFRELYGPSFRKLQSYARDELGVRDAPAQTTFVNLTSATATAPDWKHVSLLVRICVQYADETKEDQAGLAGHLGEILDVWKSTFLRLGGVLPEPLPAKAPLPAPPSDAAGAPVAGPVPSPVVAELPAVAFSGAAPVPSRWAAGRDWMRRKPGKAVVSVAAALVLVVGAGGYMLADTTDTTDATDVRGKDKTLEAADGTSAVPSPGRTGTPSHSPSPTVTEPGAKPSGSGASPSSGIGGTGAGGTSSSGGGTQTGSAAGGTGTGTTGGTTGGGTSGVPGGNTTGNTSGGSSTTTSSGNGNGGSQPTPTPTPTKPTTYSARIAWTNSPGGGDPCDCTIVYGDPKEGGSNTAAPNALYRPTSITVICKITDGRKVLDVGDDYPGPKDPIRYNIWFKMDTGLWVPAVYAEPLNAGGLGALPTCA